MKYLGCAVTFAEYPTEIALCINITGCPNHCKGCSEPEMQLDLGQELTEDAIVELVNKNPGITLVGFQGGDQDHKTIRDLTNFVHNKFPQLKVGMYSGRDSIDLGLAEVLDYYKVGSWKMFKGAEETWKDQSAGPICLPTSNQKMYKRENSELIDVTDQFRKKTVHNWKTVIK